MSQQIPGTNSAHDSYDPPAFGPDYYDDNPEFGYASQAEPANPKQPKAAYAVPFHHPIVHHHDAILSQVVAQTNENLPLAQPEHDAGPQYPDHDPWYTNASTAAAFDIYSQGGFNTDAGFYNTPLNFQHGGIDLEPAFPIAPMEPVWDFNNIQDFDQLDMPIPAGAQLNPAPFPALVSAPPAAVPAPAPAATDRIHCPHGCPATFGRGGEYRRHMMIHEPARYRCPMVDCPRTFSRADKLRDHAKKGHGGRNPLRL